MIKLNVIFNCSLLLLASFPVFAEQTRVFHDPFAKPHLKKLPKATADTSNSETSISAHRLTSTLRAGKNSMIIVDGLVLKLGEKIDGYKLIAVHDRTAVFLKNQKHTRLTLDDNE